jgi:hypothetical protein
MAIATSTAIIAGLAAGGAVAGSAIQAEAQSDIAKAQQAAAGRMREEALKFAAPTSQELENLTKMVTMYDKMYAQQSATIEQLTDQITKIYGPAIMEQGKQYYNQLRGEASGVVKSFDSQRNRQREQLRQQLIERMGPDALTSSAGVNALNDFDQKTSDARAQIEEQSLNSSLNRLSTLQQTQGAAGSTIYNAYSGMSSLLSSIQTGYGNIQTRLTNAANLSAAPVIGSAGSENVGKAYLGQGISGVSSQLGNIAMFSSFGQGQAAPEASAAGGQPQPMAGGFRPTAGTSMGPSSYLNPWEAPQMSTMPEPTFGDFTFNK